MLFIVFLLSITTTGFCINRPVYKIVLTQKGFSQYVVEPSGSFCYCSKWPAQTGQYHVAEYRREVEASRGSAFRSVIEFVQYDIDTPPIREFTFCTWIRFYDLENEQGLFSYVVNGNRVIRLWLDSGGHFMKVAINEKIPSMVAVDVTRDVWRHICLSYQSDYGAWALYMDGKLVTCETRQSLYGFVLPGGGSVIIGYGTTNVIPSGLEGEVFGANMILKSTIERNHTLKRDPLYEQKLFLRNRVIGSKSLKYIVLGELDSDDIQNNFETTKLPTVTKTNKYFIGLTPPYSLTEHVTRFEHTSSEPQLLQEFNEKEYLDFSVTDIPGTTDKTKINFWSLVNQHGMKTKLKAKPNTSIEQIVYGNRKSPTTSVWKTSPTTASKHFSTKSLKSKTPMFPSLYELNEYFNDVNKSIEDRQNKEIETEKGTSPPTEKDTKAYGQWTSSKFAGTVLNYLKRINFYNREQVKVPSNIPLIKISDTFPYPTEFKGTRGRQPLKFQRRNFVDKHYDKRDIKKRKISGQVSGNDLRSQIPKCHAIIQPTHVETTRKSVISNPKNDHRFYRNADSQTSSEYEFSAEILRPKSLTTSSDSKFTRNSLISEDNKRNNLLTILPFIKSIEYFVDDANNKDSNENLNVNDLFPRSLAQGNKWHNVQTYNNDFTPRRVNVEVDGIQGNTAISEANKKLPSVRLKYKPNYRNFMTTYKDATIIEGRALAKEVSNQSNKHDSISILKYNRGFLPKHRTDPKSSDKINDIPKQNYKHNYLQDSRDLNFHTEIKLRDSINEHQQDFNTNQNKKSYVRGDVGHSDINRYKTEIDSINEKTPPSHGPKICKTLELRDHVLHVQPDGSVDHTPIVSPVKDRNTGIEFIMQNYKRCSLQDSYLEKNSLLFIDWNQTPVRLFGGAYPKKTTDLCGFF